VTATQWSGLVAVVPILLLLGWALLVVQGFRDGDRSDDTRVDVRVLPASQPGEAEQEVMIVAHNPGQAVILASAQVTRVPRIMGVVAFDRALHTATFHGSTLGSRAVLGALPPEATHAWRMAMPDGRGGLVRVRVWLDHADRRTRIASFLCPLPPARPILQREPLREERRSPR
jgi:hypothetical protein